VARSKIIVITGATSGIGAAVARAFCKAGVRMFLVGRNARKLAAVARRLPAKHLAGVALADLGSVSGINELLAALSRQLPRVDVLVHAAGEHRRTKLGSAEADDFDSLFALNVRAPFLLTQGLLPALKRASGQVIYINSSVIRNNGEGVAAYKATRHALQGLVDSLRQGLNRHKIRVTSLFLGQTATPHLRTIYVQESKRYQPRLLMSAKDVAQVVVALAELPAGVEVTDLHLRSSVPY
jgi:NADP-dependent 3-hydroxy acid dehydrogenase YdfG